MRFRSPIVRVAWGLLALGISAALLYWCSRDVDLDRLRAGIQQVRIPLIVVAALILSGVQLLVAVEWTLLLPRAKRVAFSPLLKTVSVMVMLQNALHHFAGHAFAVYQLGHRQRVGKSVMLSVLAVDQLAEATARLLLWGLLGLVIGLPTWAGGGVAFLFGLSSLLYVVLLVAAWRHRDFEPVRTHGQLHGRQRIAYHFQEWAHHLHGVRDVRILLAAITLAVTKKGLRAVGVYCVQQSFGLELPWYAPLLCVGALDLATMISITPGHLGIFEATLLFIYTHLGLSPTDAMLLGLFDHLIFLAGAVLPGFWISLVWGFQRRRSPNLSVPITDDPSPIAASHARPRQPTARV